MNIPRRSFLSGLATLPLIGGGVALIGRPTAAAVPVTDALHERYLTWLAHEHLAAVREHKWRSCISSWVPNPDNHDASAQEYARRACSRPTSDYLFWMPEAPDVEQIIASAPPSSRAAVVLSAAGVPLTGRPTAPPV